jgi:hypothetical protein
MLSYILKASSVHIIHRFADRDMFMRFLGGEVGHAGQDRLNIHWRTSDPEVPQGEDEDDEEIVRDIEIREDSDEELDEGSDEEGEQSMSDSDVEM